MFRDARLKVQRANKHIADIQSVVLSLPDRYISSIETDSKTGGKSIKHECPGLDETLTELSLIAGDAIHNLRASLDYAWIETLQHLSLDTTKYSKFPITASPKALNSLLTQREINTRSPALFKCMEVRIRPYPGGNDLLCALHELDISDKHLLRLRLVPYGGIEGIRLQDQNGTIHEGGTWASHAIGPRYVDFEPNIEIKDKGQFSFSIVFDEAPAVSGGSILDELTTFSALLLNHLQLIEDALA